MSKYFKVIAKGGHLGAGNSAELVFYIKAKDAIVAMTKVKNMPAVKHDKSNAISSVSIISEDEYNNNIATRSAYDAYNNRENI